MPEPPAHRPKFLEYAVLVTALVVVTFGASDAIACKCAPLTSEESYARHSAIFWGRAMDEQQTFHGERYQTVKVERWYKGESRPTEVTLFARSGTGCAFWAPAGGLVAVQAHYEDGVYLADICGSSVIHDHRFTGGDPSRFADYPKIAGRPPTPPDPSAPVDSPFVLPFWAGALRCLSVPVVLAGLIVFAWRKLSRYQRRKRGLQ